MKLLIFKPLLPSLLVQCSILVLVCSGSLPHTFGAKGLALVLCSCLLLGLVFLPASWSCVPGGSPVFVPTPGLVFLWAAWSRFLVGSLVLCSHFLLVAFVQWWAVPPSLKKRFRKTSIGLSYVKKETSQIETLIS